MLFLTISVYDCYASDSSLGVYIFQKGII